jgi:hypothetical protein
MANLITPRADPWAPASRNLGSRPAKYICRAIVPEALGVVSQRQSAVPVGISLVRLTQAREHGGAEGESEEK